MIGSLSLYLRRSSAIALLKMDGPLNALGVQSSKWIEIKADHLER